MASQMGPPSAYFAWRSCCKSEGQPKRFRNILTLNKSQQEQLFLKQANTSQQCLQSKHCRNPKAKLAINTSEIDWSPSHENSAKVNETQMLSIDCMLKIPSCLAFVFLLGKNTIKWEFAATRVRAHCILQTWLQARQWRRQYSFSPCQYFQVLDPLKLMTMS